MASDVPIVAYKAADFIRGTQYLTPWAELAYRRICDFIYESGDRLRDDDKVLKELSRAGARWPKVKTELIDKGKVFVEDGWISNERCRAEIRKARDRKKKADRAADKRWNDDAQHDARNGPEHGSEHAKNTEKPMLDPMPLSESVKKEPGVTHSLTDCDSRARDAPPRLFAVK